MYEEKLMNDFKYFQSNTNNNCNCSKLNTCNCLKVCELINHNHESIFKKEPIKITDTKPYPNVVSSYDFPWTAFKHSENLVKSSYNSNELTYEANLLNEIKESQEKLKTSQKLEKTTDLVDDMINKFKILQDEMKKKSEALKLKSEYDELKKEIRRRSRSRSRERRVKFDLDTDTSDLSDVDKCSCTKHKFKSCYSIYEHGHNYSAKNSSHKERSSLETAKTLKKCLNCHCAVDYNIY